MFYKKYKISITFAVLILAVTCLMIAFFNTTTLFTKVIDINEYAVLYSDDTAEIIFRDTFNNQSLEIYRGNIKPIYIDEEKSSRGFGPVRYILPEVNLVGSNNDRVVFTLRNRDSHGSYCDSDIFYIDRITKTSKVIGNSVCIVKPLDEHIYTRFWSSEYLGIQEDGKSYFDIGVGNYATGELISQARVKVPVWTDGISSIGWYSINPNSVVANPEMTKVAFAFTAGPECGDYKGDCDTPAFIYILDVKTSEVLDVTPEQGVYFSTLYPDGDSHQSLLIYEQDDSGEGRFVIANIGGSGSNEPYAVIDGI